LIAVSDTGSGISEDEITKLFRPFYTTKPKGLGLGLAFCMKVVEAHGGAIEVSSQVNKGTTFTIRLPA
jgi:signal transduction histidine kinase